ncbi:MAG: FUSC family protein [Verrucomicrobiia bacterium]
MSTPLPASAFRWEQACFAFLRSELAPSATRWRDALRLTLLCALATTIIIGYHIPYGEFLVIFFFAVCQPDAWASLRKARLRGLGTLIGGGLAIVGIVVCGDKPGLLLVGQAGLFAVALFFSRTTTIPYALILAMFTFVIVMPVAATDPDASLQQTFWRILLTCAGAVIGTVAQLVLWPDHPEKLLLRQLAARLETAETILDRVASAGSPAGRPPPSETRPPVAVAMTGQLDLLASAEAGSRWLQQRHTEQIKLITDIEMVLITALRLERLAAREPSALQTEALRDRVRKIRHQLARFRQALAQVCWPMPTDGDHETPAPESSVENESAPVLSVVAGLERIVRKMPAAMAFLAVTDADWRQGKHILDPLREPVAKRTIFTPACRLSNVEVVRFALKGALAATICYVVYQALNWPGISTCVVTCLITAQSSFGAGLQKALLRLAGAILGAVATVAAVVILWPNLPGAASFIVVTSALFFAASWLTVGSSRVSYIGLQMGLVVSLVLLNQPNQSVDLVVAGDRILGVLLGVTVMGFIDLTLWPNFAGSRLRRKLAETARALAELPRHAARQAWDAAGVAALAVHGQIAAALALYDEGQLEFGSRAADDGMARGRSLAAINGLEEVFCALLVVFRHRRVMSHEVVPTAWQQRLHSLDEAVAQRLDALADPPGEPAAADPGQLLAAFAGQLQSTTALADADELMRRQLSECALVYRELVDALQNLAGLPAAPLASEFTPETSRTGRLCQTS